MRINSFLEKPHFAQSIFQLMSVVAVKHGIESVKYGLEISCGKNSSIDIFPCGRGCMKFLIVMNCQICA